MKPRRQNAALSYWGETLKAIAGVATFLTLFGGAVLGGVLWLADVQTKTQAKAQHDEIRLHAKSEHDRIEKEAMQARGDQRREMGERIDRGFDEMKDDLRGIRLRIDAVYQASKDR